MASLEYTIPEGALWGDYFYDEFNMASSVPATVATEESDDGWETVGAKKVTTEVSLPKQTTWCKYGNACMWRNCPFRHERCEHHDKWMASGKKTRGCRCLVTDPDSCKSPEDGGCKYDHRDLSKLAIFYESVPAETEAQIWTTFYQRGLEACSPDIYDTSNMRRSDKALLMRSLTASNIKFDYHHDWIEIRAE